MPLMSRSVSSAAAAALVLALVTLPAAAQSPASGRDVLQRMRDAYAGKWYSTLRFVQKTTRYGSNGAPTFATWYESLRQTPDGRTQLRIDLGDPVGGNGILYTADSSWVFRGGKLSAARAEGNEFLPLIEGVYMQPVDATIRQLASTGVDMNRVMQGTWDGRSATVIGVGSAADSVSPQIWVDDERNVVVRMLLRPTPSSPPMDIHLGDYVQVGAGWLATKVAMTVDGKPVQTEDYADWKVGMPLPADLFTTGAWSARGHWATR
jgi:hypothetical protein